MSNAPSYEPPERNSAAEEARLAEQRAALENRAKLEAAAREEAHQQQAMRERELREEMQQLKAGIDEIRETIQNLPAGLLLHLKSQFQETAIKIVRRLSSQILDMNQRLSFESLRTLGIYCADIEHDCEQLKAQIAENRFDGSQPCLRISTGSFVPVSDSELRANEEHYAAEHASDTLRLLSNEEAVAGFGEELAPTIAHRCAAESYFPYLGKGSENENTWPHFLRLSVFSDTLGGRAYYSPAYFIRYQIVGAPLSPVIGMIPAGRHIFMVATVTGNVFDNQTFDSPPDFSIPLSI
jgi:uncharacterized FlaG/YvyC family protein